MALALSLETQQEASNSIPNTHKTTLEQVSEATLHLVESPFIINTEQVLSHVRRIVSSIKGGNKDEAREQYYRLKKTLVLGFKNGFRYNNENGIVDSIGSIYSQLFIGNFDSKLDTIWGHYCLPNFSSKFIRIEALESIDPEIDAEDFCKKVDACVL